MGRKGIFAFSAILGVTIAAGLVITARGAALAADAIRDALLTVGWAGFVVGATVGIGATLGPRDPLPIPKCILAHALILVSSMIGGFIGSLFPEQIAFAGRAVQHLLERSEIAWGSGIGAAVGTALEIIHVYRMRRRPAPPE